MEFRSNKGPIAKLLKLASFTFVATLLVVFANRSLAASGEEIFKTNCTSCHALTDKVLVGPGLAGVTEKRSEEWLIKWVRNSQELIASGDADAIAIFEEFNKIQMPGYPQFSDEELAGLVAYMKEAGAAAPAAEATTAAAPASGDASTPTDSSSPATSPYLFWLILAVAVVGFFTYRYVQNTKRKIEMMGFHPDAHKVSNYPAIFILFLAIAGGIIYVLSNLLFNNTGLTNQLAFMVFPYVAFSIFIIGSIYRYTKKGYKVSSLSSQFLEGKKLFWGSQPFHWGILILFCGHLTAFLFPRAILAWNGEPVRLLILEISSFAFGLSALLGIILLIKRRLASKSLLVVSNKMDMVVYVVLLTQIVSGLGVAFFVRWGSSWFSSVLTPYLRSIFSFNPDITAVSEMPLWIQIHVVSAFAIIAIIPFTRFMHFLVAPIDYIWRRYQLVIWNWNRKAIRSSTQHTFGKNIRNH